MRSKWLEFDVGWSDDLVIDDKAKIFIARQTIFASRHAIEIGGSPSQAAIYATWLAKIVTNQIN
jgi:hypothetical protein